MLISVMTMLIAKSSQAIADAKPMLKNSNAFLNR